jgi:hypothetical protein
MSKKVRLLTIAVMISLVTAVPVLAAAPAQGTVIEGESVPGVALGDSRAQVEAAWGQPYLCQNMSYYDGRQGLNGICEFDVDGGGRITVYYFAPDGGPAQDSADDVVDSIRWPQAVSGWVTTAGVNTTLALDDPQAVIDAYPNAEVTYSGDYVYRVRDTELGIEVLRSWNVYGAFTTVSMSIFNPRPTPPPQEKTTRIVDIDLTARKAKGQRQINAQVQVQDERGYGAPGATVIASWVFPDGSTYTVQDTTRGSSGSFAYFTIDVPSRGTYTLRIEDILLDGYRFDAENSLLRGSIKIK